MNHYGPLSSSNAYGAAQTTTTTMGHQQLHNNQHLHHQPPQYLAASHHGPHSQQQMFNNFYSDGATPIGSPTRTAATTMGRGGYNTNSHLQSSTLVNSSSMGNPQVQEERIINSTVLHEELLSQLPANDQVRYVEVPVPHEVIKHIPKIEYVEVPRRVPRYETEWTERIVEVPRVEYIDRYETVQQIQEIPVPRPVKQIVNVPKEIVKYVTKHEPVRVEKTVEVPGEVIQVPKPYTVERKVQVPNFLDQEVATVVAQKLVPHISESATDTVQVELREYNPRVVPVDVFVPRPVVRPMVCADRTESHKVVDIPVEHFNSLLKVLNPGVADEDLEGKLVNINGIIPMAALPATQLVPPNSDDWKAYHTPGQIHVDPASLSKYAMRAPPTMVQAQNTIPRSPARTQANAY